MADYIPSLYTKRLIEDFERNTILPDIFQYSKPKPTFKKRRPGSRGCPWQNQKRIVKRKNRYIDLPSEGKRKLTLERVRAALYEHLSLPMGEQE